MRQPQGVLEQFSLPGLSTQQRFSLQKIHSDAFSPHRPADWIPPWRRTSELDSAFMQKICTRIAGQR